MSWYRTGTVTVTNGGQSVVGAGTAWLNVVRPGWGFVGPDGRVYEVQNVTSDTAMTIARAYAGSTAAGAQYDAYPTQGELAALAAPVASLVADFTAARGTVLDGKFLAGSDAAPGVAAATDTNTGLRWPATDSISVVTGGVERLRVNASGNVGIGTSGPSYPLDVNGAMRATAFRNSLGNVVFTPGNASQPTKIGAGDGSSYVSFHKSGTMTTGDEAMRISATGNVGIGTTSPLNPLHVRTSDAVPGLFTRNSDVVVNGASGVEIELGALSGSTPTSAAAFGAVLNNPATTGLIYFKTLTAGVLTEKARIDASGNVGIGESSPATRLHVDRTTDGASLTLAASGATASQVIAGVGVVTAGRPFVGTNVGSNAMEVGTRAAAPLILLTDSAERVRVDASGNVGIGRTPAHRLDVSGVVNSSGLQANAGSLTFGASKWMVQLETGTVSRSYACGPDGSTRGIWEHYSAHSGGGAVLGCRVNADGTFVAAQSLGVGADPTAALDINSNTMRLRSAATPASSSTTGAAGTICWDSSFVYVCVATNTWKRSPLSSW